MLVFFGGGGMELDAADLERMRPRAGEALVRTPELEAVGHSFQKERAHLPKGEKRMAYATGQLGHDQLVIEPRLGPGVHKLDGPEARSAAEPRGVDVAPGPVHRTRL